MSIVSNSSLDSDPTSPFCPADVGSVILMVEVAPRFSSFFFQPRLERGGRWRSCSSFFHPFFSAPLPPHPHTPPCHTVSQQKRFTYSDERRCSSSRFIFNSCTGKHRLGCFKEVALALNQRTSLSHSGLSAR